MRLLKYIIEGNSIASGLKISKPDKTEEYTESEVSKNLKILISTIDALKEKTDKISKAALKDCTEKLRAWANLAKDKFGENVPELKNAKDHLSGKAPKSVGIPVSPDTPMPIGLAMKSGMLPADPEMIKDLEKEEE